MSLIDKWAEKQILSAIEAGQLDNLPGKGKPLKLDDNRWVPESLRAGYRLLKNSGHLPQELEQRKAALDLYQLIDHATDSGKDFDIHQAFKELRQLELKLRIKGIDTQILNQYRRHKHFTSQYEDQF